MKANVFVGIDVSKRHLDVALPQGIERVSNDPEGVESLAVKLNQAAPALVVLEATGGYETALVLALQRANLPVAVVNPRQARDFARAQGRLAKTDWIDARVLASFGEAMRPAPLPPIDASREALAGLVARRRQLIEALIPNATISSTPAPPSPPGSTDISSCCATNSRRSMPQSRRPSKPTMPWRTAKPF